MAIGDIPAMLKHMTLAIYEGSSIAGAGLPKFMHAFKIARGVMTRDGYLAPGSEEGDTAKIKLTPKGVARNAQHLREGPSKTKKFTELFLKVQPAVEEPEPSKANKSPDEGQEAREKQKEQRLRAENKVPVV